MLCKGDTMGDEIPHKLFLCNGLACKDETPWYCFLLGGECCHTTKEEFSATKMFPDIFTDTYWLTASDSVKIECLSPQIYMKRLIG